MNDQLKYDLDQAIGDWKYHEIERSLVTSAWDDMTQFQIQLLARNEPTPQAEASKRLARLSHDLGLGVIEALQIGRIEIRPDGSKTTVRVRSQHGTDQHNNACRAMIDDQNYHYKGDLA